MFIRPWGGGYASQSLSYQAQVQAQLNTVQNATPAAVPNSNSTSQNQTQAPSTAEAARYEEVKQASQAVQSNYFVGV